jgi:quinol monooxygenase YgiN
MNEQAHPAGNVHLIVEVTASEGKHVELGRRIASLARASRSDDGVVRYDVVQDATDKNVFRFIECWRDNAALAAHHRTEHVASFSQDAPSLLAKPYTMLMGNLLEE